MNISEFFINKVITTTLLVVTVVIFGIFAYLKLPVSDLPSVDYPVITIKAAYAGANPEIMTSKVAIPLEEECMKISGLENVISKSFDGYTEVILNFEPNKNIDLMVPEVQAAIQRAKMNMPPLQDDPVFVKTNPSDRSIIEYVFYSETINEKDLYDIVDKRVVKPLHLLPGVSCIEFFAMSHAIRIKLDPDKMGAYNTTLSDVKDAIKNANLMLPGGALRGKYGNVSVNPEGQLTNPKAYDDIIIRYNSGNPITLKDIGSACSSCENENFHPRLSINGKDITSNLVFIGVHKKPGSNTIEVADNIKKLIEEVKGELPKSIKGDFVIDFSKTVRESVHEVKITLFFSFFLVLFVMLLFFGRITDTIIPGIVVPITILATCIVMYFAGFSIDNLSLLAIILAIGFIVDDSIVILENTMRHIESGISPYNASVRSSKEVTGSVISMTVSIMVVFIPIIFMPGIVGKTFKEFAFTVIIMVFCSGIISLCLTPMMNAHMLSPFDKQKVSIIREMSNSILASLIKSYSSILKIFLNRPYLSLIAWVLCILLTLFFYYKVPKSFIPPGDSGIVFGNIVTPLGTSTDQIQKYQDCIHEILKRHPDISMPWTSTGWGYGVDQSEGGIAFITKPTKSSVKVIKDVQEQISKIPYNLGSVHLLPWPVLDIDTGGNTGASGTQYSYMIFGTNRDKTNACAVELTNKLKQIPEFTDVQNNVKLDMPQLKVEIAREKASQLGISVAQIENALSDAFSQNRITDYMEGLQRYNVYLQMSDEYSKSQLDLSKIFLRSSKKNEKNNENDLVPLSTLVTVKNTVGPKQIVHYNQLNTATVSFNLAAGVPLGTATDHINKIAKQVFPASVGGSFEGTANQFLSSLNTLAILIFIAIFLLYIALGVLYESYIHPFTVLTTLPTATVGGLGLLYCCGSELSLFAYIGMFMLIGIVAKNGIMMVDFSLQDIRNNNTSASDAIYRACLVRFRPILMTGLTAIAAALPIVIGIGSNAELRRPLGIVIIGGLIVSQLVTLFVTPGFFIYMQKIQERHLNKYRFTRAHDKMKTDLP